MNKLTVIGIGFKPLDAPAREALSSARFVVTSRRLHDVFTRYPEYETASKKVRIIDNVDETMRFIRQCFDEGTGEIVLVGSGDPLFFGIGRRAVQEFGSRTVRIMPDLTSLQAAFSRIKVAWDDALFMSLHAGPNPVRRRRLRHELKDLPELLKSYETIGILTDRENNPSAIARFLVHAVPRTGSLLLYVGEKMGYEDERITAGTPDEIASMSFQDPNVVIVVKQSRIADLGSRIGKHDNEDSFQVRDMVFGLREEEIAHSGGMITKDEVRAVAIHALRLPAQGVLWDIGAGSGAVSLEAARLSPGLDVFAVEKDEERRTLIERNMGTFGVRNITVVAGSAPEALSSLPDPHRVFVGGSGERLAEIVGVLNDRMGRGIVVIDAATLETLNKALQCLEEAHFRTRVSEISVARSKPAGGRRYMAALNPIFIVTGEKE